VKKLAMLGLFTLGWTLPISAQPEALRFERIGLEQGLSQSSVFVSLQDSEGFLWFGAQDGLNRYDGYRMTVFRSRHDDPHSLSDSFINDLVEGADGSLWIATNDGLNRYAPNENRFYAYPLDPADAQGSETVHAVLIDGRGIMWAGTEAGLYRLEPPTGRTRVYRHRPEDPNSLNHNTVHSLLEDRDGRLWVGTIQGLHRFERESQRMIRVPLRAGSTDGKAARAIHAIIQDANDPQAWLWAASDDGLVRLDPDSGELEIFRFKADAKQRDEKWHRLTSLCQDEEGLLWVGSNSGLIVFDPRTQRHTRHSANPSDPYGLGGVPIESVYRDSGGLIWVGTSTAGISKHNPRTRKFGRLRRLGDSAKGLSSNLVMSFAEDGEGAVWIGSWNGGMSRYDRQSGAFEHFAHDPDDPDSLPDNRVMSLYAEPGGPLWVGLTIDALVRFNRHEKRFESFPLDDPARPDDDPVQDAWIMDIEPDDSGALWLATSTRGLMWFDPDDGAFRRWRRDPDDPESLSEDSLVSLCRDRLGRLWLGTSSQGLCRFDPRTGRFASYPNSREPHGFVGKRVRTVVEAANGVMWAGSDDGLNRYLPEKDGFVALTTRDGLPNNLIYGILEDDKGRLWISTNEGLCRYDPGTGEIRNFTVQDGLQSNEFNTGAYLETSDGAFFFGGIAGVNYFFPQDIDINPAPPKVALTGLGVLNQSAEARFGRSAATLNAISLSPHENYLTFEFAALDFANAAKNRYRYKMEGVDRDWVEPGSRLSAHYANLEPGDYVFRVKAANNFGIWNEQGVSLPIHIKAPFWQTWWFRALAAAALALALLAAHRFRLRAIAKQKRLLETLIADRTAELRQKNDALRDSQLRLQRTVDQLQEENQRRRSIEAALREAKEAAESANRVKSDFLATVSHEIRTPLNGVIGMTELLDGDDLKPDQRDCVDAIKASGETLLALINNVLDLSKIEAGAVELEQSPFDLAACIEDALQIAAPRAASKRLALNYWIDPATPPKVLGDPVRLKQILVNLIGNAVKFTHAGSVFVRAAPNAPPREEEPFELCFAVEDTGIGIEPEQRKRLFLSFSQLDTSTTRRFGGTGLGLAISKKLAILMGGDIEVKSEPGRGSVFSFTVQVKAAPEPFPEHQTPGGLAGMRALYADPSPHARQFVASLCRRWGVDCRLAATTAEAMAAAAKEDFHVGLLSEEVLRSNDDIASRLRARHLIAIQAEPRGTTPPGFEAAMPKPLRQERLYRIFHALFRTEKPLLLPVSAKLERLALDVLLVEDNRVNQKLAARMLEKLGCRVALADDGQQAVAAVRERVYDVILMDLQMPVMDGLEATRRIIEEQPAPSRPKIIAMTANAMQGDRERCLAAGMDDYLSKPIVLDQLRAAIVRNLPAQRPVDEPAS